MSGLTTTPPLLVEEEEALLVLTTVLGLEGRSIGFLPMPPTAFEVTSLEVEFFLAMIRGFFFFLGFRPIIILPLLDIFVVS